MYAVSRMRHEAWGASNYACNHRHAAPAAAAVQQYPARLLAKLLADCDRDGRQTIMILTSCCMICHDVHSCAIGIKVVALVGTGYSQVTDRCRFVSHSATYFFLNAGWQSMMTVSHCMTQSPPLDHVSFLFLLLFQGGVPRRTSWICYTYR